MVSGLTTTGAFFDLDGTLYADYVWRALTRHHIAHRFHLATLYVYLGLHLPLWPLMRARLVTPGFFYRAWGANMAWLVRGVSIERAEKIWGWLLHHEILPNLHRPVMEALNQHKEEGHHIVLISGTFQPLLSTIASCVGAQGAIATPLTRADGRYTGQIDPPLNIGRAKVDRLHAYLQGPGEGIRLHDSFFYTDSIVDLPLLEIVGHPIAAFPDDRLAALAASRGWRLIR
jgi:HAD superfamily hydrolase (TIGR01490 family)